MDTVFSSFNYESVGCSKFFLYFCIRNSKKLNVHVNTPVMIRTILFTGLVALAANCASPKHNDNDNNKTMKTENLIYFNYDHHNSMSQMGERYKVSIADDGRVHVVIDEGFPDEKEFYLNDSTIFSELLTIVKTYKMDKYKEKYKRKMLITDGDSWSLSYTYDSKRHISSGGYMAWPDNYREMRKALSDYFKKWRDYQVGVLVMDFFKFTCKNKQGSDIEYSLERGDTEATLTLRNAEKGINKKLKVSNDYLKRLQQKGNSVDLKSTLYDYHSDDEEATVCTYFVRYNTGDTISGYTCHTQYPSHKVRGILEFFSTWVGK